MSTPSLTVRVTDYIFDHIRRNQLGSGEELPSEIRTSTELNVSRGVVREAFRSLQVAGIIDKENGRSPRVGSLNSDFLTHLLVHGLHTRQISLKQVLELRASIEVRAVRLATERCKNAEIDKLRGAVEGMSDAVDKLSTFVRHDLRFHRIINGATGNPLFDVICGAMLESMQESIRAGLQRRRGRDDIMKVVDTHRAILDAIQQRNPAAAEQEMKKHFEDTLIVVDRN